MAKSLGMIHTVNYELGTGVGLAPGQKYLVDLPGQLTNQLQRMVRAAQYFKVVGIDVSMRPIAGATTLEPLVCAGKINYYAPTRGRCEALKNAYKAVMAAMKVQGIRPRNNRQYDFRVPFSLTTLYVNGGEFLNQASIDGTNMLTLDESSPSATDGVFEVYNGTIQPTQTAAVAFSSGFGLPGQASVAPTDFVLNEGEYYEGSLVHSAELEKEFIPFLVSYGQNTATDTAIADDMEWRPDPALYLAILTGQLEFHLIDCETLADYILDVSVHVSGWKSVLGRR